MITVQSCLNINIYWYIMKRRLRVSSRRSDAHKAAAASAGTTMCARSAAPEIGWPKMVSPAVALAALRLPREALPHSPIGLGSTPTAGSNFVLGSPHPPFCATYGAAGGRASSVRPSTSSAEEAFVVTTALRRRLERGPKIGPYAGYHEARVALRVAGRVVERPGLHVGRGDALDDREVALVGDRRPLSASVGVAIDRRRGADEQRDHVHADES